MCGRHTCGMHISRLHHMHWAQNDAHLLLGAPTSLCWKNAASLEGQFPAPGTRAHSTRPAVNQTAPQHLCSVPSTGDLSAADQNSGVELLLQHAQAMMSCGHAGQPACDPAQLHSMRIAVHAAAHATLRFYIPPGHVSQVQLNRSISMNPMLCGRHIYDTAPGQWQPGPEQQYMPQRLADACRLLPGLLRLMGTIAAHGTATDCRWDPSLPDLPGKFVHPLLHPAVLLGPRMPQKQPSRQLRSQVPHPHQLPHDQGPQHYLVAFALHQKDHIMPHMVLQLLALVTYLPANSVLVSCYESGSTDSTPQWLHLLQGLLDLMRIPSHFVIQGSLVRSGMARIPFLAKVRNAGLAPLYDEAAYWSALQRVSSAASLEGQKQAATFPADKIIYLNDPFFSWQDLVRLALHDVDLACGLDYYFWEKKPPGRALLTHRRHSTQAPNWLPGSMRRDTRGRRHPQPGGGTARRLHEWEGALYDIWVTRDIGGSGGPVNDTVQQLASQGLPHPVQCCWNAGAVMNAAPFRPGGVQPAPAGSSGRLQFRAHAEGECASSECTLMCNDFWKLGFRRVLLDPSVRLSYEVWPREYLHSSKATGAPILPWWQVRTKLHTLQVDLRQLLALQAPPPAVKCCALSPGQDLVDYAKCYMDNAWLNRTQPDIV